jgi:hypothetical protein
MKNNIQKNEIRISLLNKINGIRKLTKSQKSDLEIGLDVYLQIILCGNIGSESWCEENLNKKEFIYFMEYIGKDLEKVNYNDYTEFYKLIEDELDLETVFKLS